MAKYDDNDLVGLMVILQSGLSVVYRWILMFRTISRMIGKDK